MLRINKKSCLQEKSLDPDTSKLALASEITYKLDYLSKRKLNFCNASMIDASVKKNHAKIVLF